MLFGGREGYDLKRRTLIFPRRVLGAKTPNPLRWAAYYWRRIATRRIAKPAVHRAVYAV